MASILQANLASRVSNYCPVSTLRLNIICEYFGLSGAFVSVIVGEAPTKLGCFSIY